MANLLCILSALLLRNCLYFLNSSKQTNVCFMTIIQLHILKEGRAEPYPVQATSRQTGEHCSTIQEMYPFKPMYTVSERYIPLQTHVRSYVKSTTSKPMYAPSEKSHFKPMYIRSKVKSTNLNSCKES